MLKIHFNTVPIDFSPLKVYNKVNSSLEGAMWYFLSSDVAGGITGPVDLRTDLEKWIDANGTTLSVVLALGLILLSALVLLWLKKTDKEKDDNDKE